MRLMNWRFFFDALAIELPMNKVVVEWKDFDDRFSGIINKHLALLGWWCFFNLLIGLTSLFWATGSWWYFMLMNLSWAFINFGIVILLFDHTNHRRFAEGNALSRVTVYWHVKSMLLLNIGLDSAYMIAGLYIQTLSRVPGNKYPELWEGFGWSVLLQGGVLFLLDNGFRFLHGKHFHQSKQLLEKRLKLDVYPSFQMKCAQKKGT